MSRINVTLPEEFLKEVDKTAKEEHLSRSELFRRAVQAYWELRWQKAMEKKRAQNIEEAIAIQKKLRAKAGDWDGVAEIRKWREAR